MRESTINVVRELFLKATGRDYLVDPFNSTTESQIEVVSEENMWDCVKVTGVHKYRLKMEIPPEDVKDKTLIVEPNRLVKYYELNDYSENFIVRVVDDDRNGSYLLYNPLNEPMVSNKKLVRTIQYRGEYVTSGEPKKGLCGNVNYIVHPVPPKL